MNPVSVRYLIALLSGVLLLMAACQSPPPTPTLYPTPTPLPTLTHTPASAGTTEVAVITSPAYPGLPTATANDAEPYPITTPTPPKINTLPPPPAQPTTDIFMPVITHHQSTPTATTTPTPTWTPTPSPTPTPTIDFAAVQAQLRANGQELGFAKIGFHVGIGGNTEGLETWMRRLDAAGVPFFLKSVDNAQPILLAQELMKASGVPHTLVYRRAAGEGYDVPNYAADPETAAHEHWQRHTAVFPPELDPSLVWLETINEVDKNQSEWLAQFALTTAHLALDQGYKWAAFGWSSGEPEPEQWQSPTMLAFLRLAADHPDRLAIALHEYSFLVDDIAHEYPYKVGRFQELFRICDAHAIPRPTVLITEWGWTYQHVPGPTQALQDIAWASEMYAHYPQVKGAAIWFLGRGDTFADIANETQRLITPSLDYNLGHYFAISPHPLPINPAQHQP